MWKVLLLGIIILGVIVSFVFMNRPLDMPIQRVTLTTSDRVTIVGDYYPVEQPKRFVLFLHMMPATRESWRTLAEELQKKGIASLAIDFRGHGRSDGGPYGYKNFSDAEQQKKRQDVESAVAWLKAQGATEDRLVLVGASIGANLAVEYAAVHPTIPAVALLSPGLDYHGVLTEPAAKQLAPSQRLFLAASAPDDQESFNAIQTLAGATNARVTKKELANEGHGTTMTHMDPDLFDELVQWIIQ